MSWLPLEHFQKALKKFLDNKQEESNFNYVDITVKGCEGCLNLFFDNYCVALISDISVANKIRNSIKKRKEVSDELSRFLH